jgi:hypothetical protein
VGRSIPSRARPWCSPACRRRDRWTQSAAEADQTRFVHLRNDGSADFAEQVRADSVPLATLPAATMAELTVRSGSAPSGTAERRAASCWSGPGQTRGAYRNRGMSLIGHTNFISTLDDRQQAYRQLVEHAARGSITIDWEPIVGGARRPSMRSAGSRAGRLVLTRER